MINRRQFLRAGAAATAALAFPFRAYPFSQSVMPIKKFAVDLPLLVADGATGRGIPVLSPTQETINGVMTDVYEIVAGQFTQDLLGAASGLGHATKLWGYASAVSAAKDLFQYLGGVIVATRGTPVQLRVTNKLPAAHILPVDTTLVDQAVVPTGGRTDIIAVHLHGGFVFWIYDGGPFAWYSNPANGGFVQGQSFMNGGATEGTAIYNYPNDQSARTIWYHDHAYSLTRTNVFAGLASAYLITDSFEAGLISSGTIPGNGLTPLTGELGFPLIIQDKTFWPGPGVPANMGGDPGYGKVPPAGADPGDLWYPHVYEGDLDENLPAMVLPPVVSGDATARWSTGASPDNLPVGTLPQVSTVPEYFSDTILVNGAPYPAVTVDPRRYRFRFLNASQGRFYNLQLYVADNSPDGITLVDTGEVDNNGNPILAPQNRPGPAFIQIANEAGFLPEPAVFSTAPNGLTNFNSNRVMGYKSSSTPLSSRRADVGAYVPVAGEFIRVATPGDPTIGNADRFNLLMAPAERPDVIIDFRGFTGQRLILYNDAPAPFPGGDIRNDYYGGNFDLTPLGGAPPTVPGFGPDTRVLMRFEVSGTEITEPSFADTVTALRDPASGLPFVFSNTQPGDITPTVTNIKSLLEDNDEFGGRLRQLVSDSSVSPITLLDFPTDVATAGEVQRWEIYNTTADTHPMHFHLVNVKVRSRQQWAFNPDGSPVMPLQPLDGSPVIPPDPNEMGWKETVRMNPGEITTVDMQFDLPAGTPPPNSQRLQQMFGINGAEYVWHCHILEHEEHDMMHALVVLPAPAK